MFLLLKIIGIIWHGNPDPYCKVEVKKQIELYTDYRFLYQDYGYFILFLT